VAFVFIELVGKNTQPRRRLLIGFAEYWNTNKGKPAGENTGRGYVLLFGLR